MKWKELQRQFEDCFRDVLLTGCNFSFAETLLRRGADLNPVVWDGQALLHVAIHWGRIASAEWLLEKGVADPNTSRGKNQWPPLHQAASRGDARIVEALLEHGARPEAVDSEGKTASDIAQDKRRTAVLAVLQRKI